VEAAAQAAKRKLPAGVDATPQSMMIQIESGNAEVVEALIESGVQVDLAIDGRTPLRAALDGVERNRSDAAIAVLGVLLRAGPRELVAEIQRVVRNRDWDAMMSLRQAGLGSDLRVGDGVPLVVALLRQMPDASWMERFVAAGPALDGDSAAFLLLSGCRYGDFGLAKAALSRAGADARVDPGPPDWEIENNERILWSPGGTALHMLAASRHQASPATIDSLLERNASAAIDQDGNTALMIASAERKVELAKQLVAKMDAGAIAICNRDGRSAIEMAVGTPAIVAALLARLVPAAATHGVGALHRAGYEHDEDSARMLLDAAVGVDGRREGVTALLDLSRFWYSHMSYEMRPGAGMRCLQLLVDRGASVGARDTDGRTALHWLAQFGDREAVELLLRSGAEVNAADARGCTPLMYAAGNAASEVLVGAGARAEDRDRNGYSADNWAVMSGAREDGSARARLVRAVRQGDVQAAVALLGETPANICDGWGSPLLHVAARRWDHEVCAVLLMAGSGVDQRDPECRTALYEALTASPNGMSLERLRTTVKLLLQNGSAVEDVNGRGDPASHVGLSWWFDPVFARDLLKRCRGMVNASGETVLMRAAERGSADQVHDVVGAGCELDARDARGRSALFRFSPRKDGSKNTRVLLEAGANANLADHEGVTPLMEAAQRDDLPALELLMQYGADPGQRNAAEKTAREIATLSGSRLAMNWLWRTTGRP
jgi:ankyrin repeat protein